MDSNYRIIISTSSLNIEDWTDLYRFIDSIYTNGTDKNKISALNCLKEKCIEVRYTPESNSDVYQLNGEEVRDDILKQLGTTNTCFSILYQKNDDKEDFTGFAPFVLFLRRFKDKNTNRSLVSLGINTDGMKDQAKAIRFYFKLSYFFIFFQEDIPTLGHRTLYFYSQKEQSTINLAGKGKGSKYKEVSNGRFLPLLQITEENYHSLFTTSGVILNENSNDYLYVKDLLNRIKNDFKNAILKRQEAKLDLIVNYKDSLFGQWLINGFFYSCEPKELRDMPLDEIKGIIQTLQTYKNSIFELIQNIIFHGGKSGFFYCVFDKKENVSSYYQNNLPDLKNNDSKVNRFMKVGIYDFHETGIVDSFKERERIRNDSDSYSDLSMKDFFDTNSITTIGVSRLDMRYAARLGIKSFVKTVFKHNGYFCVESNKIVKGLNLKKRLTTTWEDKIPSFPTELTISFAPGTHYVIILPVLPSENTSLSAPPVQRDTILKFRQTLERQFRSDNPIIAIDLDCNKVASISDCDSKEHQIDAIRDIGNNLIEIVGRNHDEIALNLNGKDFDHILVFKILAYLQLKAEDGFKKIILINGTDQFINNFFELIYSSLLNDATDSDVPIWSNTAAIILMSEQLHVQIIYGQTKDEFCSINQAFQKYYYYNSYPEKANSLFTNHTINPSIDIISNGIILPYDILVLSSDGTTPFERFLLRLIQRSIRSNDLGLLVNLENTCIDNSIIARNYYEVDTMFRNNFFADRYAYLIAKNLQKCKRTKGKDLVLIGYHHYSEFLLKAMKRIINDQSVHIVIASDETVNLKKKPSEIDISFNFEVDGNGNELRERILQFPNQFQYVTIVPIGTTLSTNDIIIDNFKLWHKQNDFKKRESTTIDFIYNHCIIIVRDTIGSKLTKLEENQKWKAIHLDQRIIETEFQNAKEIYYTIQVAKVDSTANGAESENVSREIDFHQAESESSKSHFAKSENWLKSLNDKVSFPKNWQEEKYVNYAENSSINSQNLIGFPIVSLCEERDHQIELERLFELRNDIYKGHFDVFDSHHKYFFDIEAFVRRRNKTFYNWLTDIKVEPAFNLNKLNVLIIPNAETESDFVGVVNDLIFDGNAVFVYLDIKKQNNNNHKMSFLKNMDKSNVSFHYIDHILLSGETYHQTKSYLFSTLDHEETDPYLDKRSQDNTDKDIHNSIFDSIITVVNDLPYTEIKEIKNDVNHFYAFINLNCWMEGRGCELCKLMEYYEDLSRKTVLDGCKQVIKDNIEKLTCKSRIDILKNKRDGEKIKRDFLRLVTTHELYYRISQIAKGQANNHILIKNCIYEELDAIYCLLCDQQSTGSRITNSKINQKINDWFIYSIADEYHDLREYCQKKLEIDKKISFLKVISSPPLSKYIIIREYAHNKLLNELYKIIHKNDNYTNDDLKVAKSVLKSLSFLKSNALVRKDVIIGIWNVMDKVISDLEKTKKDIERIVKNTKEVSISIDVEIKELNTKEQLTVSENERRIYLISVKNQEKQYFEYLKAEKEEVDRLLSTKDESIRDFSRDVQFFIKNAIVEDEAKATFLGELIRKGTEMSSFDSISISKTKLSFKNNKNQNEKNDLFKCFQDYNLYPNDTFRKEYINFLVWLFYDNTTIIRKTLDNISKELKRDHAIRLSFYKRGNKGYELKTINEFRNGAAFIKKKMLDYKINYEDRYASFKPYLLNGDEIDYVDKLIYVTYAKLKIEDLIENKHEKHIDLKTDIKDLLNIFSEIMGADAAFFIMKKDKKSYPVAVFKKDDPDIKWDNEKWFLSNFYTDRILSSNSLIYPIIPLFDIQEHERATRQYGEQNNIFDAHSLNVFIINHPDDKTRASITFLYKKTNLLTIDESEFRIKIQEYGRLLLLLKNGIDRYFFDYLIKERVFDLWLEGYQSSRRFEKVYSMSNHTFSAVYDEMAEFENIDKNTLGSIYRTWYFLTNQTINFLYSDIERKSINGKHRLSIGEKYVIDEKNTLGKTFNEKFIFILSRLLDERWNEENETKKNIIVINGQDIHDYESIKEELNKDGLINNSISMNKHLLRTIIAQCLHNSLAYKNHGHRNWGEIKRIEISITKSRITIEDNYITDISELSRKNLQREIRKFRNKKRHIQSLNCDVYSSTTLTTLQGVINYLNQHGYLYQCEYGFNQNNNFCVTIKYQEDGKENFNY